MYYLHNKKNQKKYLKEGFKKCTVLKISILPVFFIT
jgi:hypothetical protein